jgi:hypothetical protein
MNDGAKVRFTVEIHGINEGLHNHNQSIIVKLLIAVIVQPMSCLASSL